jgi:very-short-patch-repair endonuclease
MADLAAAGLSRGAVARRVADGRLRRLHCGVFLVGPLPVARTREMAAVLACGESSVVSHRAAAAMWGIRQPRHGDVDVTVTARHPRDKRGVRVHRTRHLDPQDVTRREGVPITTAARTLLDLACTVDGRELARALEEAEVQRLVTRRRLTEMLARHRGHRGAKTLRAALARYDTPAFTRSEAERRMLALIRAARLPAPGANVHVNGHEVDLLWPEQRLIVEVDGFAFHSTRHAFERDRTRDAQLQAAGYRVLRVTWRQIQDEPEALIATLAASLQAGFAFITQRAYN